MKEATILVLPGDGIGPEVVNVAARILRRVCEQEGMRLHLEEAPVGGAALDHSGTPLPPRVLSEAKGAEAVLLGAVGGPAWDSVPHHRRPEQALLGLRGGLKLFANLRPVRVNPGLVGSSSLRYEVVEGVDLVVVRELTGGIYFGRPRGIRKTPKGRKGYNTEVYWQKEIERIALVAFELAQRRRQKVTSVDKANILESSILWRETVSRVARRFSDVAVGHMYVDNCAMQLVKNPKQFDVILTNNLFGDILSDEAAMLSGSIGMLPSASLGSARNRLGFLRGLYEPVHGSAPDIAGKGLANPCAAVLSCALLARHSLGLEEAASRLERAVERAVDRGWRTADLYQGEGRKASTTEMGEAIIESL